jgi:hypothetical protein
MIVIASAGLTFSNTYLLSSQLGRLSAISEEVGLKISVMSGVLSALFHVALLGLFGACLFVICLLILNRTGRGSFGDFFWLISIAQAPRLIGLLFTWGSLVLYPLDSFLSPASGSASEYVESRLEGWPPLGFVRRINLITDGMAIVGYIFCTRSFFRISVIEAGLVVGGLMAAYKVSPWLLRALL